MYWPSTSLDGEFVYKKIDGKLLDANYYLSKYEDTLDTNSLDDFANNNQEDPLEKQNIVGSFCRAYSISEAILTCAKAMNLYNGRKDVYKKMVINAMKLNHTWDESARIYIELYESINK